MRLLGLLALACALTTTAAQAQSPLERGRYLVETIAGCGNCHTPQGPNGPLPGRSLAGGMVVEDNPAFTAIASNITPDRKTGIGAWTDEQIFRAIREGIRPDGSLIGPPMPFGLYRGLADADVRAIVAYLRTVPPVPNPVAKSTYRIALPPAYGPPVGHIDAPPRTDKVAYGAYLAGPVGHCMECHTPMLPDGQRDTERLGAGGQPFNGPWGTSVAANITPAKARGLGDWSDAQIERAIRTGVSADGRKLFPPMAFGYYAKIAADDMAALIIYLRSLPPQD
ncbi:cytochrome c [Limobrevibacterium gyesilva]|uniref:Cytochrome c n=1 Tax=Limobrevibacterium gyesilva TaxID=2991712 RepID=A0AA41YW83_9PROT|nr:cytochrome c [Limobrevibacterium gyesilva]MCW3476517.1 cytochrome c [Limobrevibacterium gyesilva]